MVVRRMVQARKIAIIDDDLASVEVLVVLLRKAGHDVHYFYDGLSAYDFVRTAQPDLVVSDMLMPKLHGLDLCRRLKSDPQLRHIPVVLMTGVYRDPRHKSQITEAGADAFFTKPFDLGRTVNQLQALLGEVPLEIVQEEVREEVAAVMRAYMEALPGKIQEVELLLERLQTQGSVDALAYLHLQVHSLAGSSATFGLGGLSKWASAASAYLRNLLDRGQVLTQVEFAQIRGFVHEMKFEVPGQSGQKRPVSSAVAHTLGHGHPNPRRRRVFLVEPNLAMASEITLELELYGFEVRHFLDEEQLYADRSGQATDAIVMAFEMPEGQLIRVREHPIYRLTPLILISDERSMNARLAAVRVGGDAFLGRPLDTGVLVAKLHELTHPRRFQELRVLLVNSQREEAEALSRVLAQAEMTVKLVTDPLAVMEPLDTFSPDVVIVDMDLTGCSGVELVRLIHQDESHLGLAILLLVSEENPLRLEELYGEGVEDVLVKPVKPGQLVARITHRCKRFMALRLHLVRDGLTGLLNPSSVLHYLGLELDRARRRKGMVSVALIDIDMLGRLNEMLGPLAGNVAIRGLAGMLIRRLRSSDVVGRFEGPAMIVVLPETHAAQADSVAHAIVADFAKLALHVDDQEFYATCSCGIATYPRYKDLAGLVEAARGALQKAKDLGGNRICLAD